MQVAIAQKLTSIGERFAVLPADDLVVLDELAYCVGKGLADLGDVVKLLDRRPRTTEVVLTGRDAPQVLIDKADLVTEMGEVKHPYAAGVAARAGIEY